MTLTEEAADIDPPLGSADQLAYPRTATIGSTVPAAVLTDRAWADWVRSHGVSVTARGDDDLDLVRFNNIRPVQVVYRCGTATAHLHRAVAFGVSRYIVNTEQQIARVAEFADSRKYLYLDDQAPLMVGDRRLKVIGLHADILDDGSPREWASAARRLIHRSAILAACGSIMKRIVLSGASTQLWAESHGRQASVIVRAVDEAVRDECNHYGLPQPAVTLAASSAAPLRMPLPA